MNRIAPKLILTAALGLLLSACGPTGNGEAGGPAAVDGQSFRMVPVAIQDPMINDARAFSILVPFGWEYAGEVQWRHNMAILASASMTIANPAGGDLLQIYPLIPFSWLQNPVMPIATGSVYLGTVFMPPIEDPTVFLQQMVFSQFRGNASNVVSVSSQGLTRAAQDIWRLRYNSDPNTGVRAVKWTVRYTLGGQEYEEAFFCALSYAASPIMPGSVIWQPEYIYSIRSFRGGLAKAEPLLQASMASLTVDLKWYAQYLQVHKLWQDGQMQAIRSAGELSRYITQVNDDISRTIVDGYNQRQASEDRIFDSFSEAIRGVETYDNPVTGRPVQLPSDYREAWVSGSGEFFLSNSGADPNVGSTQTWTRLTASDG